MTTHDLKLMMVAGEASGDEHAGRLFEAFSRNIPDVSAFGMGGEEMRRAGVEILHGCEGLSVTGFGDILKIIPELYRVRRDLIRCVRERRPAAVILVDYPGFNLALARSVCKLPEKPRLIYFIPPQVWGWWEKRARAVARNFDMCLTSLPFEPSYFRRDGGNAEFVGNPVAYNLSGAPSRKKARSALGISEDKRIVALLPGSRAKEVARLMPPMLGAVRLVRRRLPEVEFLVPESKNLPEGAAGRHLDSADFYVKVIRGRAHEALRAADMAVVASGTATLEAGLLGTPMVVVYRDGHLSYLLLKYFLSRVDYISLVNLLAGWEASPELLQYQARPAKIAAALLSLLENPEVRESQLRAFARIRGGLGGGDPYEKAAGRISTLLGIDT